VLKKLVSKIANGFGYEYNPLLGPRGRSHLSDHEALVLERVKPYTLTSAARILSVVKAVSYVCRSGLPGAIVECGVWRGGSMLAAAMTLRAEGDTSRELYLFDTFEGMSKPTERDRDHSGRSAQALLASSATATEVLCEADIEDVKRTMRLAEYPMERMHFVAGKVEDTLPAAAPTQIALLRLDTDWYESTYHELVHLYPALQIGGVLIIDDYGYWQGAREATDKYFSEGSAAPILLNNIDFTGRIAVKSRQQ
jgi:O-methyltransferase